MTPTPKAPSDGLRGVLGLPVVMRPAQGLGVLVVEMPARVHATLDDLIDIEWPPAGDLRYDGSTFAAVAGPFEGAPADLGALVALGSTLVADRLQAAGTAEALATWQGA